MPLLLCDLDETILERREALERWAAGFARDHGLPSGAVRAILDEDHHGART
ncbi:MAG: HAD family hydrolase, partial [Acidimicrobiia bacterium]